MQIPFYHRSIRFLYGFGYLHTPREQSRGVMHKNRSVGIVSKYPTKSTISRIQQDFIRIEMWHGWMVDFCKMIVDLVTALVYIMTSLLATFFYAQHTPLCLVVILCHAIYVKCNGCRFIYPSIITALPWWPRTFCKWYEGYVPDHQSDIDSVKRQDQAVNQVI